MTRPDAVWPAVFIMKTELRAEKDRLLRALSEMSFNYWGDGDPDLDITLQMIHDRIVEITNVLNRISVGAYRL